MSLFSDKKVRDRAREESAQQSLLGAMAVESVESAQARMRASEGARGEIYSLLGAPGTYDLPGTEAAGGGGAGDFSDIYDTSQGISDQAKGLIRYGHKLGAAGTDFTEGTRKGILDPKKYAGAVSKTSGFRTQSRLQAQAEQLLAREGAEWERLSQGTLGQISEGAAVALKESMREIRNRAAKGGTARRAAVNEAQQIQAIQSANEMRIRETWQANIRLDDYIKQNARTQQESNARFLDNLPGIRQQYNETMNNLADMMARVAIPTASTASAQAYATRSAVKEPKIAEKLIMAVVSGLVSYVTGGAVDLSGPLMSIAEGGAGNVGGVSYGNQNSGASLTSSLLGGAGSLIGEAGTWLSGGPKTSVSSEYYTPATPESNAIVGLRR